MRHGRLIWLLVLILMQAVIAQADNFKIAEASGKWRLLRDGQPFYIKGAVGWERLDLLRDYGANAVRIRASKRNLDRTAEYGLVALANLPVRGERSGMDWDDENMVAEQKRRVLATVNEFKDHPAVMLWAVGNELDWIPPGRPHSPNLWKCLNDLAVEIHRIDPHHPVLTVVGTGSFERKIQEMAGQCTAFDLLGINTYGDIDKVTALATKHWRRPFVIAEWGPTGHWQVPRTEWKVPIEQTSTQKAQVIFDRYRNVIEAHRDKCLGSFVFLWAQKQETTHTWYGMFRDGLKTESVDLMKYLWTGSWPANRAPAVLGLSVEGFVDDSKIYLEPDKAYRAQVTCYDADYDELTFKWDIRREVEIPPNSYAGGMEKPAKPIPGLIEEGQGREVRFKTPEQEGPYRLFVEIHDGHDHAGYGNLPFYVKSR